MVVTKWQDASAQSSRDALCLQAGEQMSLEAVGRAEICPQIPIGPAVIPAKGDDIAVGMRARDAHRDGHRLSASAREAHHMRPWVYVAQELCELHFFRCVQCGHRTSVNGIL